MKEKKQQKRGSKGKNENKSKEFVVKKGYGEIKKGKG